MPRGRRGQHGACPPQVWPQGQTLVTLVYALKGLTPPRHRALIDRPKATTTWARQRGEVWGVKDTRTEASLCRARFGRQWNEKIMSCQRPLHTAGRDKGIVDCWDTHPSTDLAEDPTTTCSCKINV